VLHTVCGTPQQRRLLLKNKNMVPGNAAKGGHFSVVQDRLLHGPGEWYGGEGGAAGGERDEERAGEEMNAYT
jgi:hypothetical protein